MPNVSKANIAANRVNAKRSTGPRTPEGKARSSQNARKHIFHSSSFPVIRLEEVDDVERLRADAITAYQPANSQETFAVERIVLAQQALLRAERLHSGMFNICLNYTITGDDRPLRAISPVLVNNDFQICQAQNRNFLLAEGFQRLFTKSGAFTQFLRYQAQAERLYRRAIEEFDRLRKRRDEFTNEPEDAPQLTESEALIAEKTNPDATPAAVRPSHPPEHYGPNGELLYQFLPEPDPILDPLQASDGESDAICREPSECSILND